ncbi:MAG: hypothetical protein JRJ85_17335 [Deltaproteobacteria bacterium]|nr:hypothetical protein [Deltaproteobacteria bacterium]
MKTISKGKRIVHFCNYTPLSAGLYPETRDLIYEELRRGYDAWLIDHTVENNLTFKETLHDSLYKEGRVIRIEEDNVSRDADIICWHDWIPEEYMKDRSKNIIMFLHAITTVLFNTELHGGEKVISFLKQVNETIPHCHFYITLWPVQYAYWKNIIRKNLVVTNPIIDTDCIRLKPDTHFDPTHLKLVVLDSWRGGREPYYIFNAIQLLMERYHSGELPYKVSLDIYGIDPDSIPPVWHTIIRDDFRQYFHFKGRDLPQNIYDAHDIILTQVRGDSTESRVVREGLLSGTPIVAGLSYVDWTEFKHDCCDLEGYAHQIEKCWNQMQDKTTRQTMHQGNRKSACNRYDIRKNAETIFECYEKVFTSSATNKPEQDSGSINFDKLKMLINECNDGDSLKSVLEKLQSETDDMTLEEAVIRLMVNLPFSE